MSLSIKRFVVITAAVISITIVAIAGTYAYSRSYGRAPAVIHVMMMPETKHIGETIHVEVTVDMPWSQWLTDEVELAAPDGLQVVNTAQRQLKRIGIGRWQWVAIIEVQAYDFGPFSGLVVHIPLRPDRNGEHTTVTVQLDTITITPKLSADDAGPLDIAGELPASFLDRADGTRYVIWGLVIVIAIIIAIGVLVRYWLRRSQPIAPPPQKPWVIAERALSDLRDRLPLDAETVFVELTDIVRRYIEAVYQLRATETTTPEFLHGINTAAAGKCPLSTEQRLLLTDFLTAADMVKFARVDATQEQIDDSLNKAKTFIVDTSEEIKQAELTNPGTLNEPSTRRLDTE